MPKLIKDIKWSICLTCVSNWYVTINKIYHVCKMQEELLQHQEENEKYLKLAKLKFNKGFVSPGVTERKLSELQLYKCIGKGAFGQVFLVKYCDQTQDRGGFYALKMLEKKRIIEGKQFENTKSELKILNTVDCAFIINLVEFFMDNVYLFFLLPYLECGDMFTALRSQKRFEESISKFYASQVILAFEYLHYMGIVYRDLKPENILIDINGYLKLADLGFCKKIDDQRTYTLCGNYSFYLIAKSFLNVKITIYFYIKQRALYKKKLIFLSLKIN